MDKNSISRTDLKNADTLIKKNYKKFNSNKKLAGFLNMPLSLVRRICYRLGLKRMELEYFTTTQIKFLKTQYKEKGDMELAEIFQKKWPKKKGWTHKHIEKKRKYLKLKRSRKEINSIHDRNVRLGRFSMCPVKAWDKRGRAKTGEIRYWKRNDGLAYPVIKSRGRFTQWARWAYKKYVGKIPKGANVVFDDGNPYNRAIENLILCTNSELAQRNSKKSSQGLSDNYIAGLLTHKDKQLRELVKSQKPLLEIKRKQLQLNRAIYEQQKIV